MSDEKKESKPTPSVQISGEYDPTLFGINPDTLDPDLHYRFGYDSPQRQAALMAKGYRPVRRSDGVEMLVDYGQGAAEDLIKVGDTILMACKKEVFERRHRQLEELSNARLETPEGQFRRKAQAARTKVTNREMKGE